MKKLLVVVLVLAGLYAGYWAVASRIVVNAARDLAGMAARDGWGEAADVSIQGFPSRFDLTIEAPVLNGAGFQWRTPEAQLMALSYRPDRAIIFLPEPQVFTVAGQDLTLAAQDMRGSVHMGLGDTALREAVAVAKAPILTASGSPDAPLRAEELRVALTEADPALALARYDGMDDEALAPPAAYRLGLELTDLALPDRLQELLPPALAETLPRHVERVHGDVVIGTTAPIQARMQVPPQLETLVLQDLSLSWGGRMMMARGSLKVTESGQPEGVIALRLQDWQAWLDMGFAGGILPERQRLLITTLAGQMASLNADQALELPISFLDGEMRIMGYAIGPAPYLR